MAWQIITDGTEYPAASTFSLYANVSQLKAVHILTNPSPDVSQNSLGVYLGGTESNKMFRDFPHFIGVVLGVEP